MSGNLNKKEYTAEKVLVEPWITESATAATQMNQYIFKVAKNSAKDQIKKTVEKLYNVAVIKIQTVNIPSKIRIRGKIKGKKPGFKKAIVRLKEGDSIDFFGGK